MSSENPIVAIALLFIAQVDRGVPVDQNIFDHVHKFWPCRLCGNRLKPEDQELELGAVPREAFEYLRLRIAPRLRPILRAMLAHVDRCEGAATMANVELEARRRARAPWN